MVGGYRPFTFYLYTKAWGMGLLYVCILDFIVRIATNQVEGLCSVPLADLEGGSHPLSVRKKSHLHHTFPPASLACNRPRFRDLHRESLSSFSPHFPQIENKGKMRSPNKLSFQPRKSQQGPCAVSVLQRREQPT